MHVHFGKSEKSLYKAKNYNTPPVELQQIELFLPPLQSFESQSLEGGMGNLYLKRFNWGLVRNHCFAFFDEVLYHLCITKYSS